MFALLLVRRFGLAAGTYLFVYYLLDLAIRNSSDLGKIIGVAVGAAIIAFFAPRVKRPGKPE